MNNKYSHDKNIDLDSVYLYHQVFQWIKPNSTILECGCSEGAITQYLRDKYNCKMSIVEIDGAAFNIAKEYAEMSYNGNLDEKDWYYYFNYRGKKYDYILFTEVLEHLRHPELTLSLATKLLKDNGKIIFSVPNVCHNDILIKMFYNYFDYTLTGLLDNTHIHLFALNNLPAFVDSADLSIVEIRSTVFPTQQTEQRFSTKFEIDKLLLELLKRRQYGEVYQFIVLCEKKR